MKKRVRFLLADDLSDIFIFQITLFNFNRQSTTQIDSTYIQLTENHDILSLQRRNPVDSRFCSRFVTFAVIDLVQNITINSNEIPLAAWQLLLSQRQDFLHNHLPRVPITQSQEGTMEMRDEILSKVGAQDLDTSSYQVSGLEDIEFNRANSQLNMDAVFKPGI